MAKLRIMVESIVSPVFNSVSFFRLFPFVQVTPCAQLCVLFSLSSPSWSGQFYSCFHVSPDADQYRSPFVRHDFIVMCLPAYIARPFALLAQRAAHKTSTSCLLSSSSSCSGSVTLSSPISPHPLFSPSPSCPHSIPLLSTGICLGISRWKLYSISGAPYQHTIIMGNHAEQRRIQLRLWWHYWLRGPGFLCR